jgi:hypothetical protein
MKSNLKSERFQFVLIILAIVANLALLINFIHFW